MLLSLPACPRSRLPKPDGAAVVVAPENKGEAEIAAVAEIEPNDTVSKAQRLLLSPAAPAAVTAAIGWPVKGKADVDIYRIGAPGPDGGVDAAPPPAPGPDGAVVVQPRPQAMARVEVTPETGVALKIEVLDAMGRTVLTAGRRRSGTAGGDSESRRSPPRCLSCASGASRRGRHPAATASWRACSRSRRAPRSSPTTRPRRRTSCRFRARRSVFSAGGGIRTTTGCRPPAWPRGASSPRISDPIPNVSSRLALVDATGKKLSEARGRRGERVALRNVAVPPGTAALFLVASADFGWSADQRYDLRVNAELPKAGGEAEPNDDAAHAQLVTDGTIQGYLARGDVDVFRYTVTAPITLSVEIAPPERATAKLELANEEGVVLARGKPAGKGHKPLRAALRVEGGTVLIRVVAGSGEGNPDDPYRLTVASAPAESQAPPPPPGEQ